MLLILLSTCIALVSGAVPSIDIGGGLMMPQLGLGTCCGTYDAAKWIAAGGRHLDTADDYGSQGNLGKIVHGSGIKRSDFWITSKLEPSMYAQNMTGIMYQQVLKPLNMQYVDLILLHQAGRRKGQQQPACFDESQAGKDKNGSFYKCRINGWMGLQKLKKEGSAKAIGVSNFGVRELKQLYDVFGEHPAVNQIEFHPYYHKDSADALGIASAVDYCVKNGIKVTTYAPVANYPYRSKLLADPAIVKLAKEVGKTVGQINLRWIYQTIGAKNVIMIPRSKDSTHMKENMGIFDFELTDAQIAKLNNLNQKKVYGTTCEPYC